MQPLTDQQRKVLVFVEDHVRDRGYPPTLREIGEALGLANVNAVRGHIEALDRKGYITREPDKARSIRIVHSPSPLSILKRKLHEVLRTDEGVHHQIIYGMAWTTWRRTPYFEGPAREWLEEALRREAGEHGWQMIETRVAPDHVVLVVQVWPNHSPELAVRRFQAAARQLKRRLQTKTAAKNLWAKGYVVTTDLPQLDTMVRRMLCGSS